ncbi:MAG: hypothetical protein IPP71_06200 [Bacteroidetes bacterium]|nr:hypothetical protein [Bacteroidota bacterium]
MITHYSLNEIKKELLEIPDKKLVELVIALAKYKRDNKEFLNYLLYYSSAVDVFINGILSEIDGHFEMINEQSNLYYSKKSLRKILRIINKYSKYIGDKSKTAQLLLYFCTKLKNSGLPYQKSQTLINMYDSQIKKINKLIDSMHEDFKHDFQTDLDKLV